MKLRMRLGRSGCDPPAVGGGELPDTYGKFSCRAVQMDSPTYR